jgi:GTP cyclohydrolase I
MDSMMIKCYVITLHLSIEHLMSLNLLTQQPEAAVTRAEAMAAVQTLIRWAGDDPSREGLRDTPGRVAAAYEEFFSGYRESPEAVLTTGFEDVAGYRGMVLIKSIRLQSHCEHHIVPILGVAHVAYLPADRVVGISKIARLVDILGRRLQTQETLTAQIAAALTSALKPRGTAVWLEASHQCMTTRGIRMPGVATVTSQFTGAFKTDPSLKTEFLAAIR